MPLRHDGLRMCNLYQHDRIILMTSMPDESLEAGDVGTVVHVYADGQAYEVEFSALDGHTTAVATLKTDQVRPVTSSDMTHSRKIQTVTS